MKEYIEREAAKTALCEVCDWKHSAMCRTCIGGNHPLDKVPTADVVEVRHGWWISVEADVWFRCSLCDCEVSTSWDYEQDGMFDYCPCCGAKMDGGVNDEAD